MDDGDHHHYQFGGWLPGLGGLDLEWKFIIMTLGYSIPFQTT